MPKMKSHKASKSRMRITKNGKLVRTQGGVRHLLTNRSQKRKRNLRNKATNTGAGQVRRARIALLVGTP